LNHPHIIVVHDVGVFDGRPYMVTEFVDGETLRHRLQQGRLPIRDVVDIGLQMTGALAAAHARGLVHRDIKPENVMVRRDGYVKVLDFGLAKFATVAQSDQVGVELRTQSGMVIGTPRYMSPEQARGLDLDARSDVWSLGVVLYEMATGGLPFTEGNRAAAFDPDLPSDFLRIIYKALETVRDRRYQSAVELCADLKHVQRETESVRVRGGVWFRRLVLAAIPAIALAALASVFLIGGTASHGRPRSGEAYAIYLKSLSLSNDPRPNREAIAMLERASTIDPDQADTWAALGRRYYDEAQYGGGGNEAFLRSEAALRQALVVDPDHVPAAVRLLVLQTDAGRLQDGYDIARRLVTRRPDSGDAHFALGTVLRYGGLHEESARECDEAVSRDATNPRFRTCSATFLQLGRYDRALDFVRLDAGSEWSRMVTRWVYQRQGRRDGAREQHHQQSPGYPPGLVPASFHGFLARCLSGTVPTAAGRLSDDDVRTFLTLRDSEPLYFIAGDLAYCGDSAAALRLLRESILRNYCASSAIENDPLFDAMRNSRDYREILGATLACRTRFRDYVSAKTRTPG
jgi:serine/threonine protein kinase